MPFAPAVVDELLRDLSEAIGHSDLGLLLFPCRISFNRQSFPLAGLTSRKSPPASPIL